MTTMMKQAHRYTSPLTIALLLWLLSSIYIAVLPTRHYTPDAVNNLFFVESGNRFELWHSQHLLAQFPGHLVYQAAVGTLRAWQAFRIAHAVLAGLTVAALYGALITLTGQQRVAIGGGLLLWVSYGFWHFHSDPDIYAAGFAAGALLLLAYVRYLRVKSLARLLTLAFAGALALLMHQLYLEFAGLVGLSLIWLAWRRAAPPLHVAIYAVACLVVPILLYIVGWQDVSAYLVSIGDEAPTLSGWALRYFGAAQAGDVTWGVSLSARTIPLAGYTVLASWSLLPPLSDLTIASAPLVGLLVLATTLLSLHMLLVLRRLSGQTERLVALVCAATLIANGISGWWWQAGNIKFYLFMQLNLIALVALYARQAIAAVWSRWLRKVALTGAVAAVGLIHLLLALPYETRGGVFTMVALGDEIAETEALDVLVLRFEDSDHSYAARHLTERRVHALRADFCTRIPDEEPSLWAIQARDTAACPTLTQAVEIVGSYQQGRSRETWTIYRMPPNGDPVP